MRIVAGVLCLTLAASWAHGQNVSFYFGGKAGVPITRNIPSSSFSFGPTIITPHGPRLTMAPAFTLFVDDRLAVDVEALYRPIRYARQTDAPRVTTFEETRATALEVPVIVSYHFTQGGRFRPFIGAGVVPYEKSWGRIDARGIIHDQGDRETHVVFTYYGFKSSSPPMLVSAGLNYTKSRWLLRPEIRYTHSSGSSGRRPNQWDAFVGLTYRLFQHVTNKVGP